MRGTSRAAGAELPSPGPTPGLTPGTAHCLHWLQGDGRARNARPPRPKTQRTWQLGKVPQGCVVGKTGAGEGWEDVEAPASLFPSPAVDQQGEDQTKGLDPSWPRSRTVPAPQPRPGGLSLPTVCGVAALSPGTNATKPEWNRSNKQGLWQWERGLLNPAWQLIKKLIRRQGVWGDKGRAAC